MKPILKLFLVMLLFITSNLFAQKPFYYSGGQKVFPRIDTTVVLVHPHSLSAHGNFLKRNSAAIDPNKTNKDVIAIKVGKGESKNDVLARFEQDPDIEYSYHAMYLDNQVLIPNGEILVGVRSDVSLEALLEKLGIADAVQVTEDETAVMERAAKRKLPHDVARMRRILTSKELSFTLAAKLYESGYVDYAHPNFYAPLVKHDINLNDPAYKSLVMADPIIPKSIFPDLFAPPTPPNDPGYPYQFNLPYAGTIDSAWLYWDWAVSSSPFGVDGVTVVDDGLDTGTLHHEDLNISGIGFTKRNTSSGGMVHPDSTHFYHGTACGGLAAAIKNNSTGMCGIAPGAPIIPVNIFYGGETIADVAYSLYWSWFMADYGVISNSWGYNTTSSVGMDAITAEIANARIYGDNNRGAVVVFASGNNYGAVTYPANAPGVVTVVAIETTGTYLTYSNTGPSVDLCAVVTAGGITSTDRMGVKGYGPSNYVSSFGGTSAAGPQVAGGVAVLKAVVPFITGPEVEAALTSSADNLGVAGFDNTYGYGRMNLWKAIAAGIQTKASIKPNVLSSGPTYQDYYMDVPVGPAGMPYTYTWSTTTPTLVTISTLASSPNKREVRVSKVGSATGTASVTCTYGPIAGRWITVTKSITVSSGGVWRMAADTTETPVDSSISKSSIDESEISIIAGPNPAFNDLKVSLGRVAERSGFTSARTVKSDDEAIRTIEVVSVSTGGYPVFAKKYPSSTYQVSVPVANIPPGIYVVRVGNGKDFFTKKVRIK